jgi:FkbM family methyltransferase
MEQLLKRIIAGMGYEVRRAPSEALPFVRKFQRAGCAFDFWIADECGKAWYTHEGLSSSPEYPELLRLLQPGDRVLEIGTHHGFFAMLMACAVGPGGYVLGLEAVPFNALVAQAQISLNGFGGVCSIRNLAASDVPGTVLISGGRVSTAKSREAVSVQTETGDRMDSELGPFNVLKIDVEGYEGKVLAGCKQLLRRKPKLAIEVHPSRMAPYGTSVEEIFRAIDAPSYEGVLIGRRIGDEYSEPVPFNLSAVPESHFNILLRPAR